MFDTTYLETLAASLAGHGHVDRLDPGLADSEIDAIQRRFGFTFPPISEPCSSSPCRSGGSFRIGVMAPRNNCDSRLGWLSRVARASLFSRSVGNVPKRCRPAFCVHSLICMVEPPERLPLRHPPTVT